MDSQKIGVVGEDIACKYLEGKGHKIVDRNFRVKGGEIDIISKKENTLYFTEVKTTAYSKNESEMHQRPEENVHGRKIKKLSRAIQTYLLCKKESSETSWEFLVLAIVLDLKKKKAFVKLIPEMIS